MVGCISHFLPAGSIAYIICLWVYTLNRTQYLKNLAYNTCIEPTWYNQTLSSNAQLTMNSMKISNIAFMDYLNNEQIREVPLDLSQ